MALRVGGLWEHFQRSEASFFWRAWLGHGQGSGTEWPEQVGEWLWRRPDWLKVFKERGDWKWGGKSGEEEGSLQGKGCGPGPSGGLALEGKVRLPWKDRKGKVGIHNTGPRVRCIVGPD